MTNTSDDYVNVCFFHLHVISKQGSYLGHHIIFIQSIVFHFNLAKSHLLF